MNTREASEAMAHLVGGCTGWTDESVDVYVDELCRLDDPEALAAACRNIVRHWREARRPPLALVLEEYRSVLRRRETVALPVGADPVVPVPQGIEIARAAYERECAKLGKTPDVRRFRRRLSTIGSNNPNNRKAR